MWLNRNDNKVIAKPKAITINGIQHPANIFTRWTEDEHNTIGIYKIVFPNKTPNRRYYSFETVDDFESTPPTRTYVASELDIDIVKEKMTGDLAATDEELSKNPVVDTALGYTVKGSRNDLDSFERGNKRGLLELRDSDGNKHSVTALEFAAIIDKVELNGLNHFNTKWAKFDEIKAFTTVAECMLYEKTPYDYAITANDVLGDIDGTLVEGTIVTRYKNNVKEW